MTTLATAVPLPAEPPSDEELVARIVAGDAALFEILMRRYNQRVYRAVRAVLRGDDEVEDVMQQAYLNAYQHLGQFQGRARFSTWLTRIAVNEALARLRRRGQHEDAGEPDAMIRLVDESQPDPERQTVTSELRDVLEREVAALPDAFRLVLILRDVEGLSTAEAAATLEISEDNVKTRLHRARTLLRDNLYRRAGVTLDSLFVFGNARCDRVVAAVMAKL
ncbi:MAG: RNA polymerase sigma factor [Acidobacteria bacterium]|nr:RNA polymerase sigma factor [Acidobacteriota bacterium]MBV9474448.1 RNA polymerase sigma factor [Acidobacteriota bacterium]